MITISEVHFWSIPVVFIAFAERPNSRNRDPTSGRRGRYPNAGR